MRTIIPCLLISAALLPSCAEQQPSDGADAAAGGSGGSTVECAAADVRSLVQTFGERLRMVSVLAPDSIVARDLRVQYGTLVSDSLLAQWMRTPHDAPGREVSSPWPQRIEIRSIESAATGCRVEGSVVLATGPGTGGDTEVAREPIALDVVREDGEWRITAVERRRAEQSGGSVAPPAGEPTERAAEDAAAVLEQYYAAIDAGDYRTAYALWSGEGEASDQSFAEFARGYAETAEVDVVIGVPGRIEGAAGSRYVTLPVRIDALTRDGTHQRFTGTYTLRRSVVDGATTEQRAWRIHRAQITAAADHPGAD